MLGYSSAAEMRAAIRAALADDLQFFKYGEQGPSDFYGGFVNYVYDGLRNRVKNSRLYWFSGGQVLAETDLTGTLLREFVYFGSMRIARRDASGSVSYFFADHLGSVRRMTDATGNVQQDLDYYPFGGEVVTSSANTYKFTGKERDTNLDQSRYRTYAFSLARWTSIDPVRGSPGQPQSHNAYAYVANGPTRYTDSCGTLRADTDAGFDDPPPYVPPPAPAPAPPAQAPVASPPGPSPAEQRALELGYGSLAEMHGAIRAALAQEGVFPARGGARPSYTVDCIRIGDAEPIFGVCGYTCVYLGRPVGFGVTLFTMSLIRKRCGEQWQTCPYYIESEITGNSVIIKHCGGQT